MKIEDIELHVGDVDFPYSAIRELRAKCEASHALMPAPTENDVNAKLRAMAAKVGANAVINVSHKSGVSLTSWKSMTGTGLAVVRQTDDVTCPHCAETIKRAAIKCRFCGEAVEPSGKAAEAEVGIGLGATMGKNIAQQPPLEETNNPIWWMVALGVGLVFFLILASSS